MNEIEELFLEMKDTSELMIDLAYSALIYDSREIAEEVFNLEEMIDELNANIQKKSVASAVNDGNVEKALVMLRLANCIESIADGAMEIADVVLRDIEPHPILKMSVMESDTIITRVAVDGKSVLVDKTLGETKLTSKTGMWVIAIRREKSWFFGPDENTILKKGDIILARGPKEAEEDLIKISSGKKRKV